MSCKEAFFSASVHIVAETIPTDVDTFYGNNRNLKNRNSKLFLSIVLLAIQVDTKGQKGNVAHKCTIVYKCTTKSFYMCTTKVSYNFVVIQSV